MTCSQQKKSLRKVWVRIFAARLKLEKVALSVKVDILGSCSSDSRCRVFDKKTGKMIFPNGFAVC